MKSWDTAGPATPKDRWHVLADQHRRKEPDMMEARLADARVAMGLTLAEAAKQLRVNARYLAHIERHGADSFALVAYPR